MNPRIATALAIAGILAAQITTAAEQCAQRLQRQQLQRSALLVTLEQGAQ